jgi:hypothetical protein
LADTASLQAAGYDLRWLRQLPLIYTAQVNHQGMFTRLEWVADSDYRFFSTIRDEMFGYILHPVDLAANKVMSAAGRREVRDLVDAVTIHETILPLGAVIWATVEKSPGFTPEGMIAGIRRNANYPLAEWRSLVARDPIDPVAVTASLRSALDQAEAFIARMPTEKPVSYSSRAPKSYSRTPAHYTNTQTHAGRRRGHWPTNPEVNSAMFERPAQQQAGPDD